MPRTYSMGNRSAITAATRQRIVEAVLDEVVAASGEPITLQGVAKRADLSLRTLYNHFPNREALLGAAFSHHAAQSRAAVEAVTLPDTDPAEQLGHIIGAYYGRYAAMGERLTALLSLRGFPDLEAQIQAIRAWRHQVVTEVVAHAESSGLLCIEVPTAVALVFTMTSHATWQQLVGALDGDAAAAATVALEALHSALFHRY
jgi:AcrR family transcriptional regulator